MSDKKVIPLEDRLPQLKKERKQRANRRFVFYAAVFFILILGIVYFQSPLSRVSRISVKGPQIVTRQDVIQASGITRQTHIWDIRSARAAAQIRKLPTVKSAAVHLSFPNTVSIRIQEYQRKAYLRKGGKYYPILQNGTRLTPISGTAQPTDAPILIGFNSAKALKAVGEGLTGLSPDLLHNISDIHYIANHAGSDDLILYMNDNNQVVASTKTFRRNIRLYPEIAANLPKGKKGTVHLSVASYFVPYNSANSNNR
ncbi:cell division protein FtsQ/DivIB [Sporolactobacillus vineae]|uniref:cell division protein FtsQ/DivIB n=1 Tax=Sporolactobacillus vineae TaxID=444463 RepID=UPI0002882860|nr:FtsQ-type POTRA domain-containing protein [Sporolactobacillus vineae]